MIYIFVFTASPVADPTTAPTPRPAAPNTVAAATTTGALIIKRVVFRSLLKNFTSDLLNPSSTAYKNRAATIKEEVRLILK